MQVRDGMSEVAVTVGPSHTLRQAAAKLHGVAIAKPAKAIGTSTTGAMQSGIYFGYTGLIEGILARIKDERGEAMKVIATGGLAPLYAEATRVLGLSGPAGRKP